MTEFSSEEHQPVKEWYIEWSRFPKYLTTASLAFLAFSFTELLPSSNHNIEYLRIAWILLGVSAVLSFTAMLAAYSSYDLWIRIHLAEHLESLNMKHPVRNTKWISKWGKLSYRLSIVAVLLLLSGSFYIGLHVVNSNDISASNKSRASDKTRCILDLQTLCNQKGPK